MSWLRRRSREVDMTEGPRPTTPLSSYSELELAAMRASLPEMRRYATDNRLLYSSLSMAS